MKEMHIPVVVQKYGGSSVADVERLRQVALRVVNTVQKGYRVVAVISAMGRTTDELLSLAHKVSPNPTRRELDMLLSTGERIAGSLLSMAICDLGVEAISFTGSQCGIITNDRHNDARILEVRPYRVWDELDRGRVVVIAGYQGVSYKKEITTLGRGGSDTTAVAMAAALNAEYCEICSDVDGVYTGDPKQVESPIHLSSISYEEMQELALFGAKVLNAQAVEFARRAGIVIHARATSGSERSTCVAASSPSQGAVGVSGLSGLVCVQGEEGPEQLSAIGNILEKEQISPLWARMHRGKPFLVFSKGQCQDFFALQERIKLEAGPMVFEDPLEAASVVGIGVGDNPSHLALLMSVAKPYEPLLHSVDVTSLRLTLLLRPGQLKQVLNDLHHQFIEHCEKR